MSRVTGSPQDEPVLADAGRAPRAADARGRLVHAGLRRGRREDPVGTLAVAIAVLYAMTSTFLTGQTLRIDGGEPLT